MEGQKFGIRCIIMHGLWLRQHWCRIVWAKRNVWFVGQDSFRQPSFDNVQQYAALLAAQSQLRAQAQQQLESTAAGRTMAQVPSTVAQGVPQVSDLLRLMQAHEVFIG